MSVGSFTSAQKNFFLIFSVASYKTDVITFQEEGPPGRWEVSHSRSKLLTDSRFLSPSWKNDLLVEVRGRQDKNRRLISTSRRANNRRTDKTGISMGRNNWQKCWFTYSSGELTWRLERLVISIILEGRSPSIYGCRLEWTPASSLIMVLTITRDGTLSGRDGRWDWTAPPRGDPNRFDHGRVTV